MDLSKALAIEKGCPVEDLEWIARVVEGRQRIIELGSLHGRSTRAILDNSEAHIWCVDTWRGSEHGTGLVTGEKDYVIFLENIRDVRWRATVLKMFTREAAKILPEAVFDMVFIDADHSYEAVKFDIIHYRPLLRAGGLLCGHDAGRGDVDRAVRELVPHPMKAGRRIWWDEV